MRPDATDRCATGVPTARLAIWWVVASEIVIFGGLLAVYIMHRLGHSEWGDYATNTNTYIGTANTLVLLTSSLTAVLAHYHAQRGDGKKAASLLVWTAMGALTFLILKSFEWTMEIKHGYTITTNSFWSFYYTAAGLHALHVIAGGIIMLIVARQAARNENLHRVEIIGIYWHFVDLVWIFLFPLLYIAK